MRVSMALDQDPIAFKAITNVERHNCYRPLSSYEVAIPAIRCPPRFHPECRDGCSDISHMEPVSVTKSELTNLRFRNSTSSPLYATENRNVNVWSVRATDRERFHMAYFSCAFFEDLSEHYHTSLCQRVKATQSHVSRASSVP